MDAYQPHIAALLEDLEDVHDAGQLGHCPVSWKNWLTVTRCSNEMRVPPFATLAAAA
ncbi:hypothetical protein [Paraburkholderia strydomiana]|uniref:hypothetical protein n=1 Tax=Paraburkholderia strydomiana TaxID=1245417 RepID=UPI001BEBD20B|nr:hypothetical protein [Paraburkholderia strydomiana]MBT2794269.1 hypothetical protein [Paraburkholderia strydomiana]